MDERLRERADERLETALDGSDLADPRPFYRDWIRALKERDAGAFEAAIRYYEDTLLEQVAAGADPLAAWLDYGRHLAELSGPGSLTAIGGHGRARTTDAPEPSDLNLYMPRDEAERPMIVSCPADPTPAQQATRQLLVERRQQFQPDP